ncbi:MAG: YggS family pyridoxal phosphate-dependent enzyme [candidate division WOR-3 bacterium]
MYKEFLEEVEEFKEKIGRKDEIKIVAICKGVSVEKILKVYEEGCRDFGENRVQEAEKKIPLIGKPDITWHMVGHLQKNKVNKFLRLFDVLHSLDGVELAQAISKRTYKKVKVFVEVNTSGEPQKFGVKPEEADRIIEMVKEIPNLELLGVMTVGPYPPDEYKSRKAFALLREIAERNNLRYISAGMTEDWKYALMEGANVLRIRRGIFGEG